MSTRYFLVIKCWCLLLLVTGCLNNKKINSSANPGGEKFHFLPVEISYSGVRLEDSLKDFVARYLKGKNIEIIDNETGHALITKEIQRAAGFNKPADPEKFQKDLGRNEQYVFNLVTLDFKLDSSGQQIVMGWRIDPQPVNFTRLVRGKWKYLSNHKISDSPPQDELKTLCDSIIYSKSLY